MNKGYTVLSFSTIYKYKIKNNMEIKEALQAIKNLVFNIEEKPVETPVDENTEAVELAETTEDKPVDTPVEDAPAEITVESLQEQLIGMAETLADLMARIEKLEGEAPADETPVEETPEETQMTEQKPVKTATELKIEELEAKIIELSNQPATEPVINKTETINDASSYSLKIMSQVDRQRKELGK